MSELSSFLKKLLSWYQLFRRELPWRETSDPYLIWLSEIILQQTRIDQGTAYYKAFIAQYPKLEDLANAPEDEVLKLWQGLGYYSRARNMHFTAKQLVEKNEGKFPDSFQELKKLKGVGPYTAAAIASIAFNEKVAAIDGNVYRVLSRIFGIETPIDSTVGKKEFSLLANELISSKRPGDFNQAMMDFGSIQCKPKNPDCPNCPFFNTCIAYNQNKVGELPVKEKRTKIRSRYFYYFIIVQQSTLYIRKRTLKDIWKNLYEFPMLELNQQKEPEQLTEEFQHLFHSAKIEITDTGNWQKQILSHQHIFYRFIYLTIDKESLFNVFPDLISVNKKDIFNFAVPKPIEQELDKLISRIQN